MLVEYAYMETLEKPIGWEKLGKALGMEKLPESNNLIEIDGEKLFVSVFPEPTCATYICFAWLQKNSPRVKEVLRKISSDLNLTLYI